MPEIGKGYVSIEADRDHFDRSMRDLGDDKGGRFSGVGKTIGKSMAIGIGAGIAAVGIGAVIGKQFVDAASDFNETLSKSNTVFGSSAKAIEDWSETAARSLGQSQKEALDAASTFGNLFAQLGIGDDIAADMSMGLTELASDFASFHNADITDVIEAQTAAFRGEYDALQRYVPTINAAAVEQKALEQTGKESTKMLTAQDKALATHTLMLEGAGDAVGDFARTSGGAANQQRILSAQFADLQAKVGQALLPAFTALVTFVNSELIPGIQRFVDIFQEEGFAGIVDRLEALGQEFVAWLRPRIPEFLKQLGEYIAIAAQWLIDVGLPELQKKLIEWGDAFVKWIRPHIAPMIQELGHLLAAIGVWVVTEALPTLLKLAYDQKEAFIGWVATLSVEVVKGLLLLLGDITKWVATEGIPKLAEEGLKLAVSFADSFKAWLVGIPGDIKDAATDIGKKLIEFIIDGIQAAPSIAAELAAKVPGGKRVVDAVAGSGHALADELERRAGNRWMGGNVNAGQPYWVGERGPELVVPKTKSTVIPNHDLGGLGGGYSMQVYANEFTADDVARGFAYLELANGMGG